MNDITSTETPESPVSLRSILEELVEINTILSQTEDNLNYLANGTPLDAKKENDDSKAVTLGNILGHVGSIRRIASRNATLTNQLAGK